MIDKVERAEGADEEGSDEAAAAGPAAIGLSPAVSLDGITMMRVTGQPEDARRTVVHAAAFHGLGQVTRRHCGDVLQAR